MSTNDDKVTKPTIETILERLVTLEERITVRLNELDIKLDRVGSVTHATRAEMLELRADFREWNKRLREHFPALS